MFSLFWILSTGPLRGAPAGLRDKGLVGPYANASDPEVRQCILFPDNETVNDGSFTSKFPAPSGDRSAAVGYWDPAPGTNLPGDVN